jgi:DNA repair protein RecO
LREDFEALSAAAAMVNAARRLVPDEQPSADAFALLLKALRALEAGRDLDRVVLWYLLALLQAAGYQPRVDRCLVGRHSARPSEAEGRWWFVPHLGGAVCPSCGVGAAAGATGQGAGLPMTPGVHALLRQALRMPSSVRHRVSAGAELIREARGLLEACVDERGRRLIKRPVPNQPVPRSVNAAPARRV